MVEIQAEVAELRREVGQLTQELLMHRKVLEECLEVRDGLLELRSGVQRVVNEIGDRTAELDLSLAGVSDNTARHGKAISTLCEQQKRTTVTLEAVVRAVKRLDRSRSRGSTAGIRGPADYEVPPATFSASRGSKLSDAATELPACWPPEDGDDAWGWPGGPEAHSVPAPPAPAASAAPPELADCMKGVLMRIEEALTKLDGVQGDQDPADGLDCRMTAPGVAEFATMRPGPRPGSARDQSNSRAPMRTPRGKTANVANPKVYAGTPRGCRHADSGSWRMADSWA